MSTVITEQQARKITGGRKPLVPVEYENAVKALMACTSIDDAKYWSDKSDALAAWAKIYQDDQAGIEARRLKLHAYHRLGTLARELRPVKYERGCVGQSPGPRALLMEKGLKSDAASSALRISRATKDELKPHIEAGRGVTAVGNTFRGRSGMNVRVATDAWLWLTSSNVGNGAHLRMAKAAFQKRKARDAAEGIGRGEVSAARNLARDLIEWLDEFEQCLPKEGA